MKVYLVKEKEDVYKTDYEWHWSEGDYEYVSVPCQAIVTHEKIVNVFDSSDKAILYINNLVHEKTGAYGTVIDNTKRTDRALYDDESVLYGFILSGTRTEYSIQEFELE